MSLIRSEHGFALGIPEIDREHKALIDLINRVHGALEDSAPEIEIADFLAEIHAWIAAHFALEEPFGLPRETLSMLARGLTVAWSINVIGLSAILLQSVLARPQAGRDSQTGIPSTETGPLARLNWPAPAAGRSRHPGDGLAGGGKRLLRQLALRNRGWCCATARIPTHTAWRSIHSSHWREEVWPSAGPVSPQFRP